MAQGAGEIGLTGAGGSCDEGDLMTLDPVAAGEAKDDGPIEAASGPEVEVFDGGRGEPEPGLTKQASPAPILAVGAFSIEEQSEAVLEGQRLDIRDAALFFESFGHAGETEFLKLGKGLFDEHGSVRQLRGGIR
jgi:hypothetical protein